MDYVYKRRWILGITLALLLFIYFFKNFSAIVRVFGFLMCLIIFYSVDHLFDIKFKLHHYYLIMIILATGILFSPLYFFYSSYDKILHFISPILGSIVIFYVVNEKKLPMYWKLWITFLFITSFLMFHEIGEYLMDKLWDMKLQGVYIRDIGGTEKLNLIQSQIDDTMVDLIFGILGAITFIAGKTLTYLYKNKKQEKKLSKKKKLKRE